MILDHDALHELLWLRSDDHGRLRLSQTRLANELQTTRVVVHRALRRMEEDGRLQQLPGAGGPSTRSYMVVKPQVWMQGAPT